MSLRSVKVRKLRCQQADLSRTLPSKAVSNGRWGGTHRIATGAVGTVLAKPATVARWQRIWDGLKPEGPPQ